MKITIAYYLLLIYTVAMCKPMLPMVKDIVAHVFWKADHLAKIHHHNGNDHVHHEIQVMEKEDEKANNTQTVKSPEPISIHLIVKNNYDFTCRFIAERDYPLQFYYLQSPILEISSPPPKV